MERPELDGLDRDQRHAVTTPSRLVAVVAGAGSGKTRVLTQRIAHRIHTESADARHTLVVTFTRDAAGELRRRLPRLGLRERVDAGTFHAVMLGLLRQHHIDRGKAMPTVVQDRRRLLAEALATRRGLDALVAEVDWAAARGITADRYPNAARAAGRRSAVDVERVVHALGAYAETKRRRGVLDLDDVLTVAVGLLERDRVFADAVAWRYRHLLVDEAQDLNPIQHRLVDLLRRDHDDLFLVGDPAQAVYGFNGADPGLLVEVADRFPGVEVIRLGTNHRCTPQVVHLGAHVLETAGMDPTAIRSSQAEGPAVSVVGCIDEADEARRVARFVATLDPDALRRRQVAVLARTHAQLQGLAAALESEHVPILTRVDGPGSAYRPAIDAAVRSGSSSSLRAWAHDLLDAPGDPERPPVPAEHRAVADAVLDYLREHPLGDGAGLRSWINTTDPFGARDAAGVDLSTFHAAKGREWDTVVVTGVETGLVPHRSASTNAMRAEEARLLYVAVSRARVRLMVTWAERRGGYRHHPSPLLSGYRPPESGIIPPPEPVTDAVRRSEPVDPLPGRLRDWRDRTARSLGVLPEQVCDDATLREIATVRPRDANELAALRGIGQITARRWFPLLSELLDDPVPSRTPPPDQSSRSTTTGA